MSLLLLFGGVTARTFTLESSSLTPHVGDTVTLTATLLDTNGSPLTGKTIYFTVTGANSATGSDTTDVNGEATLQYVVANAGTDTAYASWGASTGLDVISSDVSVNRIYRHDGFSTTELDFFAVGGSLSPLDVAWDGDHLLSLVYDGVSTHTVRRHNGFSSTVTDSFTVAAGAKGLTWDGTNVIVAFTDGMVRRYSGFSSTVLDSFDTGKENHGVAWDGTNVIVAHQNVGDDTLTRYVGFSSSVDTTVTMPYGGGSFSLSGCAWFQGNLYTSTDDTGGSGADDLSVHEGFSATRSTIDAPSSQASGIGWTVGMTADLTLTVARVGSGVLGRRTARLVP